MAIGQESDHQALNEVFLADDAAVDLRHQGRQEGTGLLHGSIQGGHSGIHCQDGWHNSWPMGKPHCEWIRPKSTGLRLGFGRIYR